MEYESEDGKTIENDDLRSSQLYEFLKAAFTNAVESMKPGAAFYIWYASRTAVEFITAATEVGMMPRQQLIWAKNSFTLGRSDYQWKHEPCLYGWTEGGPHYFIDLRSLTTVQDTNKGTLTKEQLLERLKTFEEMTTIQYEDKPLRSKEHPTMKPVPLFARLIRNSSRPGEIVLDLFGGSGTTLLACEELDRTCYMMEYDPGYAEVIIRRWEALTGKTAVKA